MKSFKQEEFRVKPIEPKQLQVVLDQFKNQDVYIHLETTNGAYASHFNQMQNVGAFIRNAQIRFSIGKVTGDGPYRIGLKMEQGWVYGEGLTDWEINDQNQLLIAGHNQEGKLAIAFQLSKDPFK